MLRRSFSAPECRLLDALFALISSCTRLVTDEAIWADQDLPEQLRQALDRGSRELQAFGLLSQIIVNLPWQREQNPIRGDRSENIGANFTKRLPIVADEEQPRSDDWS